MKHGALSRCHSLSLISVKGIFHFSNISGRISLRTLGITDPARAVPGSILASHSSDDGIIKKKITYERPGVSPEASAELENYRSTPLVAVYVDESGNMRVCGSPEYPLALDFIESDGAYSVSLTGEDLLQDGFLECLRPSPLA